MRSVTLIPNLKGARVLVRVDYNVPLKGTTILDPRRIEASFETIDILLKKKGTPILIAHRGKGTETLRPIATFLSKRYNIVFIAADITDAKTRAIIDKVPPGTLILLENIRRYPGEEKNTASFAKALVSYGEYYINDAFSVSHRTHASVVGIAKLLPSYAGVQLIREIKALTLADKHPFLFILGGAKFGTKIPLLKQFKDRADHLVIAGAILNDFYKVAGFEVGRSVVEGKFDTAIKKLLTNPKLLLPVDVIVKRGAKSVAVSPLEIKPTDTIVDIGPESVAHIATLIKKAKLIVWNGPTGWYEKGYTHATVALARAINESKAQSVIGGGDTGAVIEGLLKNHPNKKVFVSTGGGATLEFLAQGSLPGIDCIK